MSTFLIVGSIALVLFLAWALSRMAALGDRDDR